jgi:hypothetical protein
MTIETRPLARTSRPKGPGPAAGVDPSTFPGSGELDLAIGPLAEPAERFSALPLLPDDFVA